MRTKWHVDLAVLATFISLGFILPLTAETVPKVEGLIDIDFPGAGAAKVEVNIADNLLALAVKAVSEKEPKVSELLAGLQAIKVRIYDKTSLGNKSIDEVLKFYEDQLQKGKWDVPVRVNEKDSKVGIYLLTKGDIISGIVALVGEPEEIVIVNLAGKIDIAKLLQVAETSGFKIGPQDTIQARLFKQLEELKVRESKEKEEAAAKEKEKKAGEEESREK